MALVVPAENMPPASATTQADTSSSSTMFGGLTMKVRSFTFSTQVGVIVRLYLLKATEPGDDVLKPAVPASDEISEVGAHFGSMDLDFLGSSTTAPNSSVPAQQTVQEVSLMPDFESDTEFDPLASSGHPVTSGISPAPSALAPQPVFVQSPLMPQPPSAPRYLQFVSMGPPVSAPYGVRWSQPVHNYVPVQAMVSLYLDVI